MKLINKDKVVARINKRINDEKEIIKKFSHPFYASEITRCNARIVLLKQFRDFLDTLEVIDPYEQCVQYDSIKAGIQAHAETYSFNIESKLLNQLSKEQQELWRKEIEQACISGGEAGVELARDPRYKKNLKMEEVDLKKEIASYIKDNTRNGYFRADIHDVAEYFYELGLKAKKGE